VQSGVLLSGRPGSATVQLEGPDNTLRSGRIGAKIGPLPPGSWRWSADAPGYEAGSGAFVLKVDEIKGVRIELRRLAQLTVRGEPGRAKVVVRGANFERTVGIGSTLSDLALGAYNIQVSKRGFETEERRVVLGDGAHETLEIRLKHPGNLEVFGAPQGASVTLRGPGGFRAEDGLPLTLTGAARGKYEVRVARPGYRSFRGEVTVEPERTARLDVRLERGRDGPYGEVPLEVLKEFQALRIRALNRVRDAPKSADARRRKALIKSYPILHRVPWPSLSEAQDYRTNSFQRGFSTVFLVVSGAAAIGLYAAFIEQDDPQVPEMAVLGGTTFMAMMAMLARLGANHRLAKLEAKYADLL
jgi:hypothetical protein